MLPSTSHRRPLRLRFTFNNDQLSFDLIDVFNEKLKSLKVDFPKYEYAIRVFGRHDDKDRRFEVSRFEVANLTVEAEEARQSKAK